MQLHTPAGRGTEPRGWPLPGLQHRQPAGGTLDQAGRACYSKTQNQNSFTLAEGKPKKACLHICNCSVISRTVLWLREGKLTSWWRLETRHAPDQLRYTLCWCLCIIHNLHYYSLHTPSLAARLTHTMTAHKLKVEITCSTVPVTSNSSKKLCMTALSLLPQWQTCIPVH